jgi:hypothetical protein
MKVTSILYKSNKKTVKTPFFRGKKGENASAYCAGGLASRKPEKNKGRKIATLKTLILLSSYF